ncbi:hypothetical protein LCGC14_1521510, partial [marine sediment metagenome]
MKYTTPSKAAEAVFAEFKKRADLTPKIVQVEKDLRLISADINKKKKMFLAALKELRKGPR